MSSLSAKLVEPAYWASVVVVPLTGLVWVAVIFWLAYTTPLEESPQRSNLFLMAWATIPLFVLVFAREMVAPARSKVLSRIGTTTGIITFVLALTLPYVAMLLRGLPLGTLHQIDGLPPAWVWFAPLMLLSAERSPRQPLGATAPGETESAKHA